MLGHAPLMRWRLQQSFSTLKANFGNQSCLAFCLGVTHQAYHIHHLDAAFVRVWWIHLSVKLNRTNCRPMETRVVMLFQVWNKFKKSNNHWLIDIQQSRIRAKQKKSFEKRTWSAGARCKKSTTDVYVERLQSRFPAMHASFPAFTLQNYQNDIFKKVSILIKICCHFFASIFSND